MKICILLSSYEGSNSILEDVDVEVPNPAAFSSRHTFVNRFIRKETAKEEIDAVIGEGYDFYINFIWGTLDDPVAGIRASEYFESLGLPSAGIRSYERSMTKNDFYVAARARGVSVPGTESFPLFVKPANGCASQLIDEHSICHDEEELENALRRINKGLRGARIIRAKALGMEDPSGHVDSLNPIGRSDDIVVQEFIDGADYTVTVIEMGEGCIALTPVLYRTGKRLDIKEQFMTFDIKCGDDISTDLLQKDKNPTLFETLQRVAIDAYQASGTKGNNMGCDVDLRARPDGEAFAIEINPQPASLTVEGEFRDTPIMHSLPGGVSAVIDIFIANEMLRNTAQWNISHKVADAFDGIASEYDAGVVKGSAIAEGIKRVIHCHDFDGTVIDLACGTGLFGLLLSQTTAGQAHKSPGKIIGFDISPRMVDLCRKTNLYDAVHVERMQTCLTSHRPHTDSVDHIVCFSSLQYLNSSEFAFVMVLCFALANKSITISIDEIPDAYNEHLDSLGKSFMRSINHLDHLKEFGEPPGWKIKCHYRQYSWTSPTTGDDVTTTYFRFERTDQSTRDMMFRKSAP